MLRGNGKIADFLGVHDTSASRAIGRIETTRNRRLRIHYIAGPSSGTLKVGDDIMYILVAGRFKTDVLPALDELLSLVKREIVMEQETP